MEKLGPEAMTGAGGRAGCGRSDAQAGMYNAADVNAMMRERTVSPDIDLWSRGLSVACVDPPHGRSDGVADPSCRRTVRGSRRLRAADHVPTGRRTPFPAFRAWADRSLAISRQSRPAILRVVGES